MEGKMVESHLCPVDQNPCEVLALFPGAAAGLEGLEMGGDLRALLPCQRCRAGEEAVLGLPGTRLGRHERRILLEAPSGMEDPAHMEPEASTRAASEALLRAMRKLEAHGLVKRHWVGGKKYEPGSRLAVKRTVAGDWVVSFAKYPLLTGTAIRWGQYLPEIRKRVREPRPEVLANEFRRELEGYAAFCDDHARRFPGPLGSPEEARVAQGWAQRKEAAESLLGGIGSGEREEETGSRARPRPPSTGSRPGRRRPLQATLFPELERGSGGEG